eukprot:TRINITY_DN25000_c0_g1_i1.p2 TRINITY_DN25000_c0_g1~~TRINITY_DN25000_c0_g1_i1.p2  ORF type:complete len:500 (+),score=276.93 TRINITY_DN25000_c0_g1_i1:58-1500(+)
MAERTYRARGGESEGQLKKRVVTTYGAPADSTVVLMASELQNWRDLINAADREKGQRAEQEEKARMLAVGQERKARMIRMDEEKRSKGIQKPIEELAEEAKGKETVSKAQMQMDEELDEVKYMNKVSLYTKCVTIRDAQIKEKASIQAERAEEEARQDMLMETERLKALAMYEEREHKRIENRMRGAAVIRAQIQEREAAHLRDLELKKQEQEAMKRHIEQIQEDDRMETVKKNRNAKLLRDEVALANSEQIRLKKKEREVEQAEDRRRLEYQRTKDEREQEIAAEQERIRNEKELEIARLRSLQEKAQDKQAELDALRARRAQEANEREHRQKEKAEAEKRALQNAELAVARQSQKAEKELTVAEQARLENEEFERIISVQKKADEVDRARKERELERRIQNQRELKSQIEQVEEQRRKKRLGFLEEGNTLKASYHEYDAKIEGIRQRKLNELRGAGVPDKYAHEVVKKRTTEPLRPSA